MQPGSAMDADGPSYLMGISTMATTAKAGGMESACMFSGTDRATMVSIGVGSVADGASLSTQTGQCMRVTGAST